MPHRITRRQALGSAVSAGAASLITPAVGLAASPRALTSRWIGTLAGTSEAVAAPRRFSLVGVQWGAGPARIELRTRRRGGEWSPWVDASTLGHGPDMVTDRSAQFGEPVWSGPADLVQLRSASPVEGVRLHFVTAPRARLRPRAEGGYPLALPVLEAGPGQPPIIARAGWAHGQAPPSVAPDYGTVKLAFVHHSETPNGYTAADVPAILMSIYDYHRFVRGWDDIGYNFAVDAFGRIWEARAGGIDQAVVGAQAGGYNAVSTGAVVLGSFMRVAPPGAALAALEQLLAWKLSLHGVPAQGRVTVRVDPSDAFYTPFAPGQLVSLPRVAGHRDGDSTDCPGDVLYGLLPRVRSRVIGLAGMPVRLTLVATPSAVIAGGTVALSGRLTTLAGTPLAGEPIEIQQLGLAGSPTLLETTTAEDGSWAAALVPTHNLVLGALHRPGPAGVAGAVSLAVSPQLSLQVDAVAPPQISGSVSPSEPAVTIEVYGPRGRQLRRVRVSAVQGQFAATLSALPPGRYTVRAVTAASPSNAAGRSPDVPLSVP